ncbi:hypothetical protein BC829DRAFT_403094, partial [Chytridium lagenaria]
HLQLRNSLIPIAADTLLSQLQNAGVGDPRVLVEALRPFNLKPPTSPISPPTTNYSEPPDDRPLPPRPSMARRPTQPQSYPTPSPSTTTQSSLAYRSNTTSSAATLSSRAPRIAGMSIRTPVTRQQMQASQNLDVALLVDCTASMQPLITTLENQLQNMLRKVEEQYENLRIRVGLLWDIDFDAPERLRNIRTECGDNADTAEDVLGGYYQVTKLSWESSFKLLLHFGDAPAHGSRFHDWNFERCDHWKDIPPPEHPPECAEIYIGRIDSTTRIWTNKMKDVFRQIYASRGQSKRFSAEHMNLTLDLGIMSTEFLDKVLNTASMSLMSMGARSRRQVAG